MVDGLLQLRTPLRTSHQLQRPCFGVRRGLHGRIYTDSITGPRWWWLCLGVPLCPLLCRGPNRANEMRTGARAPEKGRKTGHNGKSSAAGIFFSRPMACRGPRPLFLQPGPSPPFFWCRWQGQGFFRTPEKEGQQDCGSGGRAWGRGAVTQAPTHGQLHLAASHHRAAPFYTPTEPPFLGFQLCH